MTTSAERLEYPFLELASSPSQTHKLDIVFVHGLNPFGRSRHPFETFEHPETKAFWPRDFLGQDIPSARIFIYGYNSNVNNREPVSVARITDHANNLLLLLDNERCSNNYYHTKILFVGHSLGGLIIKQALMNAIENQAYSSIAHATFGLVFFATPHHGAKGVELGLIAAKLVRILSKGGASNELLDSLRHNGLFTTQMSERFQQRLEDYKVISFFETQQLRLGSSGFATADTIIVDRESAVLGLPGTREEKFGLDADHSSICKFATRGHLYNIVSGRIKKLAEQAANAAEAYVPPPPGPVPSPQPPGNSNYTGYSQNVPYAAAVRSQQQQPQKLHGVMFHSTNSDPRYQQLAEHKNMYRWEHAKPIAHSLFEEKHRINPDGLEAMEAAYEIAFLNMALELPNDAMNWVNWVTNACRRVFGPDHPLLMKAENIAARAMQDRDQHAESEALASGLYLRQRDLLGPDHVDTLDTQLTLAMACNQQERKDEAITRLEKRLEALIKEFGDEHVRAYHAALDLLSTAFPPTVYFLDFSEVKIEAVNMVEKIWKEAREVYGPLHPLAILALRLLGTWKSTLRNFTDAIDDLRSALNNAERAWGPNHPETALCVVLIAFCYYKQKQHQQAEPWLQRYYTFVTARFGSKCEQARRVLYLIAHSDYTQSLMRQGDSQQALQKFEKLVEAYDGRDCKETQEANAHISLLRMTVAAQSRPFWR